MVVDLTQSSADNFKDPNSPLGELYTVFEQRKKRVKEIEQDRKEQSSIGILSSNLKQATPADLEKLGDFLDLNYNNLQEGASTRTYDYGKSNFFERVADEYSISYMGQFAKLVKSDKSYQLDGFDPNFNPFESEKFKGYEDLAHRFIDVMNEKHMDLIIKNIESSFNTRSRTRNQEGWFWPMLISGTLDPINLVALHPAVRGAKTFKEFFLRGGTAVTGLVAPTEFVRYELDPAATKGEVLLNLGTSFAIGGLLTGSLGYGAKKISDGAFNRATGNKTIQELADSYNDAHSFHGAEMKDFSWNYSIKQDIIGIVETPQMQGKGKRQAVKIIVETATDKARYVINRDVIRAKWGRASNALKKQIGTYSNFEKVEIKKAVLRDYYGIIRKENETANQFDRRLDQLALNSFFVNRVDRRTDSGLVGRWVERITGYGKILNDMSIKNIEVRNQVIDDMFGISGDYATRSISARAGRTFNGSVALDTKVNWDKTLRQVNQATDEGYVSYMRQVEGVGTDKPQREILTYNIPKQFKRVGTEYDAFLARISGSKKNNERITFTQYKDMITKAQIDDTLYDALPYDSMRENVDVLRRTYKHFHEENAKYGLYATPDSVNDKLALLRSYDLELTDIIVKNKDLKTASAKIKVREATKEQKNVRGRINQIKAIVKNKNYLKESEYFFPDQRYYIPIIYDKDAIMNNKEAFINWLAGKFGERQYRKYYVDETGNRVALDSSLSARLKRARETTDKLIDEDVDDFDGILGKAKGKDGAYRYGIAPFQRRTLNLDPKEFLEANNEIADFIITDSEYLFRQYNQRASTALEMAKRFGDPHLEGLQIETKIRFIRDEIETDADVSNMERVISLLIDEKGKISGTLSLSDPASINKRVAGALRDWGSLAMMGKVVISATVDIARPIMVNGIRKTFSAGINQWMKNQEGYFKAVDNLRYMGASLEVTMGMARKRFIEDGGQVGMANSALGRKFDKFANKLHNAQAPFYTLNGLTPWTQMMKDLQGVISSHRLIEDSIAWNKGTLDSKGQLRLTSLGINKTTADFIAKAPHETFDDLFTANADAWTSLKGGQSASRKFKEALYADINRTIVTPSAADQISMMHGVIKVKDPKKAKFFEDSQFAKFLGYRTTEYGGQFSNQFMALPFQFMSWGFAANRKILVAGLQGRDQNAVMGVLALVLMGAMADRLKNKRAWDNKTPEERIVRAIEMSGVLGLFGDLNFSLETISEGATGQMVGLRSLIGADPRFGESNVIDATGEFVGAGPGLLLDVGYMFGSEATFSERRSAIRRLIPLQNLWLWDKKFNSIYNSSTDFLRGDDVDDGT